MKIRHATKNDLDDMIEIDKRAYGDYGSNKEYFTKKLNSFPKGILVVENKGKITGFIIFEIMNKNDIPEDFCDMKLSESVNDKWMHIPALTTATNYKDKKSDSKLIMAAEKIAKNEGCIEAFVPLSKNHPFKGNGVFEFWEMNGYKKIGEIKWMPNSNEFIECYFYRKSLI
jgi:ribosomal protein S18 acetylase RimI-like enzyme